jgi:hypothetical protein
MTPMTLGRHFKPMPSEIENSILRLQSPHLVLCPYPSDLYNSSFSQLAKTSCPCHLPHLQFFQFLTCHQESSGFWCFTAVSTVVTGWISNLPQRFSLVHRVALSGLLGGGGNFKRWGLVGIFRTLGAGLWMGLWGPSGTLLTLFCFLAMQWEVLLYHVLLLSYVASWQAQIVMDWNL